MGTLRSLRSLAALVSLLLALRCVSREDRTAVSVGAISACPGGEASPPRYLRQLSLDLRGAPPTLAEYREVMALGHVPESMIDGFLNDPRFVERVKRWHAEMLWPSIAGFELHTGGHLVVVPPFGERLTVEGTNPERLVLILDQRTDEPTCPPADQPGHLTALSCCTAADPDHPACCLARNDVYNPDDPACVAKSKALPATFNFGSARGDTLLRGGIGYMGCDSALEYPPPTVAASDPRWPHDAQNRPYYTSPRTGTRRYYHDPNGVPLPYDDAARCPNYCRRLTGTGAAGTFLFADYAAKTRSVNGATVTGDGPGFVCPVDFPVEVRNPCDNVIADRPMRAVELRREGFRLTRPYWARGHWIKTCAYESQERAVSLTTGLQCSLARRDDALCGCGPEGAWCAPYTGDNAHPSLTLSRLRDAINREPLEIVASVVGRDEDYATVFTTRRGMANGPLAFMNRRQAERMGEIEFSPSAPPEALPDVPLDDLTWHEYQRGPQHRGVLTTPVFLARFPTRRARVNRFRSVFLCRPFEPAPGSTPPPPDHPCNREANLARRCGCNECHSIIEPLGAAWGRWSERGTRYFNPVDFPVRDLACRTCQSGPCSARCRFYLGDTFEGFANRTNEEIRQVADGPSDLVNRALADGSFQSCTARTAWGRLLNRPMSAAETACVLPSLVRDFESHGRSYRALIRALVTSPAYRRID